MIDCFTNLLTVFLFLLLFFCSCSQQFAQAKDTVVRQIIILFFLFLLPPLQFSFHYLFHFLKYSVCFYFHLFFYFTFLFYSSILIPLLPSSPALSLFHQSLFFSFSSSSSSYQKLITNHLYSSNGRNMSLMAFDNILKGDSTPFQLLLSSSI